jgi:glycosyltransferase involved in cell wall biosynthesis
MTERRLIVEQFDPRRPSAGGVDTCIRGLIKYRPSGIEISVVGVDAIGDAVLRRWMSVEVDGVDVQFLPLARLYAGNQSRRIPHSVRLAAALVRASRKLRADTVQTHRLELGAVVQRAFRGTPHVQFLHIDGRDSFATGSDSIWKHAPGMYARLERRVVPRASDVVVFSSAGAGRLADMGRHVRFSPTWFDPQVFHPPDPPTPRASFPRVLWVGRIEPPKDPLLAADVLAALPPQATMTVVGDGTLRVEFEERLRALGVHDRVRMLGAVSKQEVAVQMRAHDVLLMTSHYEGFPRAVVESLACGLPVVTTPEGEPNGLVVDGLTGYHAARGRSAEELARRVTESLQLDARDAVASVQHLSATRVVPAVLARPGHRGARAALDPTGTRDVVTLDGA